MNKKSEVYENLYLKILNFIAYSPRTVQEVSQKIFFLLKRYPSFSSEEKEVLKNDLIEAVTELNLLNDQDYANSYVKGKTSLGSKPVSRLELERFLLKKGVAKSMIKEAVSTLDSSGEISSVLALIDKKMKSLSKLDPRKAKPKLIKYLMSKGYSYDIIRSAVDTKFKVT